MTNFNIYSPYFSTKKKLWYTDKLILRNITSDITDYEYIIPDIYNKNPGKASFEIYGTSELKWIFLITNRKLFPNNDLINDFTSGKRLIIPTKSRLLTMLS